MFFGSVEKPPRLSEFELEVPEILIAQNPIKKRDKYGENSLENPIGISCPSSKTLVIAYNGSGYNFATADSKKSAEIK